MKNVVKMMLAGVALLVASPAWAACNLAGSATPIEQATIGLTSPSTPAQIATALKGQSNYAAKECSLAEIEAVLRSANGWNSNQMVALDYRFSIPLLVAAPPPAPQSEPVAEKSTPETASAPPPVAKPSPELTAVRAELQTAKRERSELATRVKSVAALPVAALTSGEREMLNKAATLDQRIAGLEKIEARMTAAEAVNTAQSNHLAAIDQHLDANDKRIDNVEGGVAAAQAAADAALAEKNGWTAWDWAVAAMSLLALIGFVIVFRRKPKKVDVRAVVDEALKDEGLGHTVLRAEIDKLKTDVAGLTSRFTHEVKKIHNGEQMTLLPAIMKQLENGKTFDYHVMVNGTVVTFKARVAQRTPSGDALIMIDQLQKPVTAKTLFAAVANYIETGGELPTLVLVHTA